MFNFMLTAGTESASSLSSLSPILIMVVMLVIMYFLLIRPQRKKEKEQREMRNSIEIGDGITTIGGIVGRVVQIKDDTIVLETGTDRNKIRFQKWAIQDVEKTPLDVAPAAAAAKSDSKDSKNDSKKEKEEE